MSDEQATGQPPKETSPDAKRGIWKRYGHVIEAWIVFATSSAVLIQILIWARPFTDTVVTRWVAVYTTWALDLMGAEAEVRGKIIVSSIGSVEIIRECTAVYPTALYLAAVFAYRCTWRRKLIGIFGGVVVIQFFNLIRIISLMYIQRIYPDWFEYMHMVVWQSLIVFLTGLLWLLWSTEFSQPRRKHAD